MNRPLPSYFSLTFPLENCMKCYPKALELGRKYGQWNHTAGPSAVAIANRSSVCVWKRETGYTTPNLCWRKNEVFGFAVSGFVCFVALDTSFLHQTDREWPKPCPVQRHPGAIKPFPSSLVSSFPLPSSKLCFPVLPVCEGKTDKSSRPFDERVFQEEHD